MQLSVGCPNIGPVRKKVTYPDASELGSFLHVECPFYSRIDAYYLAPSYLPSERTGYGQWMERIDKKLSIAPGSPERREDE